MFCSLGHLKLKQTLTSYMFWDTTAMWDSTEKITFHSLLQNKFSKIFILSWNEWWNKSIQLVLYCEFAEMFSWMNKEEGRKTGDAYEGVAEGLKNIYKQKLLPLEKEYQFHDFHSPALDEPDFDAK